MSLEIHPVHLLILYHHGSEVALHPEAKMCCSMRLFLLAIFREILKNDQGSKLIRAFFRPLLLILSNIKGKVSIDEKTSTDIVVYACLHLASA